MQKRLFIGLIIFFVIVQFVMAVPPYVNGFSNYYPINFPRTTDPTIDAGTGEMAIYSILGQNNLYISWQGRDYQTQTPAGEIYFSVFDLWGTEVANSPLRVKISDSVPYFSSRPDFVRDSVGNFHFVWEDEVGPNPRFLVANYRRLSSNGQLGAITRLDQLGRIQYTPRIALDGNGMLTYAVWVARTRIQNSDAHHVMFSAISNGQPSTPLDISGTGVSNDFNPDIAVDSLNNVYVVWNSAGNIVYRRRAASSGAWGQHQLIWGNNAEVPRVFSTGTNVYATWHDSDGVYFTDISNPSNPIYTISNTGSFPYIAIDTNNDLHIAWKSTGSFYYRKYRYDGAPLIPQVAMANSDVIGRPIITVDGYGNVYMTQVFGESFSNKLYFVRSQCPPSLCSIVATQATRRSITFSLRDRSSRSLPFQIVLSLSNSIPIPTDRGAQIIPLYPDGALILSLVYGPIWGLFGSFDSNGVATPTARLPEIPSGTVLYAAFVALNRGIYSVSPSIAVTIP